MKRDNQEIEKYRVLQYSSQKDGNNGLFIVPFRTLDLKVVVSDGGGWDHVSVSLPNRNPNWEEMCHLKNLFFDEEETVVQFHPKKSEYVNCHPHCLHLWKKQAEEYELPPSLFVGPK